MAKTITISDELWARLEKLAAAKMSEEDLSEAYYDAATWGNVDDSMSWASDRAEESLAHEIVTNAQVGA